MNDINVIGFIATIDGIMFNSGLSNKIKNWVGYAVCRYNGETGTSVFSKVRYIAVGKYSNYSLIVLYWLVSLHIVFGLTLFWDMFLWFFNFHLTVMSNSPNSELLSEFLSNKLVFAYVINPNAIKGIEGIKLFYGISVFYFIPFILCILVILWRIHNFDFKVAKHDSNNDKVLILGYLWITVFFVYFMHYICTGAFIINHPQLLFHSILFILLLALVYGILTYAIYNYYLELLQKNSLIIPVAGWEYECSMELVLHDGNVIKYSEIPFYPVLLEDNKLRIVFSDGRKSLNNSDVTSLTVNSVLKPNGFFATPSVYKEICTAQYYFN